MPRKPKKPKPTMSLAKRRKTWRDTPARQAARKSGAEQLQNNRLVTVTLRISHNINGTIYGPGEVRNIPNALAQSLLNQEQHHAQIEQEFYGTRGMIIGPRRAGGHVMRQVPVETFDNSLVNEMSNPDAQVAFIINPK